MRPIVALALMLVLLSVGCGKKGDPRAPELATPRVIQNLAATQTPDGVALTWSRPTEYVDEEAQQKMIYRYRVSSQLKDGSLSEPSNEVEIARGP